MNSLLLLVLLPLSALSLTTPISYLPLQPVTINTNTKINIIPTFPLGSAVYTPGESVTLSIFEVRTDSDSDSNIEERTPKLFGHW